MIHVLLVNIPEPLHTAIYTLLATTADLTPIDETLEVRYWGAHWQDDNPCTVMVIEEEDTVWEAISSLKRSFPQLRIHLLTELDEVRNTSLLAKMGIAGCLMKHELAESLVSAIRAVAQGETWFGRPSVSQVTAPIEQATYSGTITDLTAREWQVLALIARSLSNDQIAAELHLARQTVRNRVSQIYEKLGVRSRAEAVVWYYQQQPESKQANS